jgi:sulfur-carrier protein adenylyltransferase/sulfurtransferase
MILAEIGDAGQARIRAARVLVVGAGGLGCAVLQYLSAAGVGRLVVVDHDRVEEANLHRQPLYRSADRGKLKAEAARETLRDLNPEVEVRAICERLTPANAAALVREVDIVVDAADAFAVTYVLNDECVLAGKPLVSASVLGLSGYVGVFCGGSPSYRAVFPDLPAQAGSCATAGVLGTAVGVMGTMQAHLVLLRVLDLQPSVAARLVTFDFRTLRVGGFSFASARESAGEPLRFIARADVRPDDLIVDLRGLEEAPQPAFPACVRATADDIARVQGQAGAAQRIVLCCRSGVRAWRAARTLRSLGHDPLALVALGD